MESAHIKDLLAHLRVALNKDDGISWGRALRMVKNIGPAKSQAITAWLKEAGRSPWEIGEWPGMGKGDDGLKQLAVLLKKLSAPELSPQGAVELVIQYYDPILKERFDDFPARTRDLEQLIPMAGRYRKLRPFLDDLVMEPPTSSSDLDPADKGNTLTLSTVHSAKGLEWSMVFVIWLVEGYFPSFKASSNEESLEEERRLLYVATTRAKDHLVLCYPGQEAGKPWMSWNTGRGMVSSFLQNLPGTVLEQRSPRVYSRPPIAPRSAVNRPVFSSAATEEGSAPKLKPGDRVSHPAFGSGVISKLIDGEKVEVLFRDCGRRVLHLGYTTLERR